jgi:hypothetical protein
VASCKLVTLSDLSLLSDPPLVSIPIRELSMEAEYEPDNIKYWCTYKKEFLGRKWEDVSRRYRRIGGNVEKKFVDHRYSAELEDIYQALPGLLAYYNSLDQVKPRKSRTTESMEKEKDYLYLLDQYEKWKAKQIEETQRKRFNPKDWLQSRKKWSNKTETLFLKHAEEDLDDETEIARIIRYAQKMKRESDRNNE